MTTLPIESKVQVIPQYVGWLRFKTGYYLNWIPPEYADKASEENAYDLIRNDWTVNHGVNLLSLQAAGRKIVARTSDTRLDYLLNFVLDSISDFTYVRKSLIQNGMLFGLGIQKKNYKIGTIPHTGLNWVLPYNFREVDKRRLIIIRSDEDRTKTNWTIWSPKYDKYMVLEDKNVNPDAQDDFSIQGYVWFFHDYEESYPYSFGLCEVLYPLVYIKSKVIQYWTALSETWSRPQILVLMDLLKDAVTANIGSEFKPLEQRQQDIVNSFGRMLQGNVIVADKNNEVKLLEHGTIGNNILKEFIQYIDDKIQLVLLGAHLTSGSGESKGGGSYALGAIHQTTMGTIVDYVRERLCETLKDDLIMDFIVRNQDNLRRLNIPINSQIKIEVVKGETENIVDSEQDKRSIAPTYNT